MTHFMRSGSTFRVASDTALEIYDELPVGTYTVGFDPMASAFFLEQVADFKINHKLYGDTIKKSERIHNTFADRPNATGVMLAGEQGSGKTLLAKQVSKDGLAKGIPTIVINQPWAGEAFNLFIQTINQPTIVIFDEFEKVYHENDKQEALLTLLDGVYPSKKLFIVTTNDSYRINQHMRNRPGRIFYRIEYKGLSQEFVYEYCEDNLLDKTKIDSVARISAAFNEFNFDMLKGMVEEMNRYGESAQEVMSILNAKPEFNASTHYTATLEVQGKEIVADENSWYGNPLTQSISMTYLDVAAATDPKNPYDGANDGAWFQSDFSATLGNLTSVDGLTGRFTFTNEKGHKLQLLKVPVVAFRYDAF